MHYEIISGKRRPCEYRNCEECGEQFSVYEYIIRTKPKHGRFCSKVCRGKWQHNAKRSYLSQLPSMAGEANFNYRHGRAILGKSRTVPYRGEKALKVNSLTSEAIRHGRLIPQPCEHGCAGKTDAHHDDYDKPYDVRWLCRKCHCALHKELRARLGVKRFSPV
jgi:hypothetical protein